MFYTVLYRRLLRTGPWTYDRSHPSSVISQHISHCLAKGACQLLHDVPRIRISVNHDDFITRTWVCLDTLPTISRAAT